ncbi:MAG: hypothetical protein ACR2P0_02785 [Acidimicrobiales bacterium]
MSGVSWSERQPDMWLASNGRWYAANTYPRGWRRTALPPAPDQDERHGGLELITKRAEEIAARASDAMSDMNASAGSRSAGDSSGSTRPSSGSSEWTSSPPAAPSTMRGSAPATVSSQRTYAPPVAAAPPPPAAIGRPTPGLPPAPGRVRDDAPDASSPPRPARSPAEISDSVSRDIGRMVGSARAQVSKAINDSAKGN